MRIWAGRGGFCAHSRSRRHQPGCVPACMDQRAATSITPLSASLLVAGRLPAGLLQGRRTEVAGRIHLSAGSTGKETPKRSASFHSRPGEINLSTRVIQHLRHGPGPWPARFCHCLPRPRARVEGRAARFRLTSGPAGPKGCEAEQTCHSKLRASTPLASARCSSPPCPESRAARAVCRSIWTHRTGPPARSGTDNSTRARRSPSKLASACPWITSCRPRKPGSAREGTPGDWSGGFRPSPAKGSRAEALSRGKIDSQNEWDAFCPGIGASAQGLRRRQVRVQAQLALASAGGGLGKAASWAQPWQSRSFLGRRLLITASRAQPAWPCRDGSPGRKIGSARFKTPFLQQGAHGVGWVGRLG